MSYSNTVSQTVFSTQKVIDSAFRRCRVMTAQITSEHIQIAKDQLYLLLSELANDGAPLWCVQKSIYPLYKGNNTVVTFSGTVDILNATLRTAPEATGTNTVTATEYKTDFTNAVAVATIGLRWSSAPVGVTLQRSDDGVTWVTVQAETPTVSSGEWSWYDIGSVVAARYFRVVAATGTLAFAQVYYGTSPTEIPLSRMNRDQYTNLPNKTSTSSRPLQYWLDRQALSPVLTLWPVPNAAAETSQIVVWAHRHIMDVGTLTQEVEVPQRWLNAITSALASRVAREIVEADPAIIPMLDSDAAIAMNKAQTEERDNSPIMWQPNISGYTR